MSALLFVLGAVIAAAGMVMIGFGIPINEFSLGNTLIIAGMVGLVGGVLILGMAAAVRQLHRLAEPASPRPTLTRPRPGEPLETGLSANARSGTGLSPRLPFPPRSQPAESRLAGPELEMHEDPAYGRNATYPAGMRNGGEPPMVEATDEVTLSPLTLQRSAPPRPAAPELALDPKVIRPSENRPPLRPLGEASFPGADMRGAAARPDPASRFEAAWPAEARNGETTRPAQNGDATRHAHRSEEVRPVSILKSGIVDGMAYTLYTDGSIEAELAQGVVRFGSIEELRNHLEKSA